MTKCIYLRNTTESPTAKVFPFTNSFYVFVVYLFDNLRINKD